MEMRDKDRDLERLIPSTRFSDIIGAPLSPLQSDTPPGASTPSHHSGREVSIIVYYYCFFLFLLCVLYCACNNCDFTCCSIIIFHFICLNLYLHNATVFCFYAWSNWILCCPFSTACGYTLSIIKYLP